MDRASLHFLVEMGLVEMKPTGRYGLTSEGIKAARAFRLLDDMLAVQTGQLKTRRDVKLRPEEKSWT